ncbi:alpha/beta hydrolase [Sphingomonas mollis]|uniref:alpha/beta hydrolase n=1 Tax=Sphingomonas mollis TaxID=2795726 RepID=UPI002FCE4A6E
MKRATATVIAAILAILPLGGLVAAMLLSPALPQANAGPDPRGPHRTLKTAAGSSLAWWSITPTHVAHRTPVVFLHGGPGTFTRNRDFAVGQGFRDAGFSTIYYDQSGSGASGNLPIERYTLANAVADLEALRSAIGAEKLVVWGQSWGASLAAAYVRAYPGHVAATILDSPGDFPGEPHPLDYAKTDSRGDFEPTLRDATLYLLIGHAPQLAERWQSQDDARATQQARVDKITSIYGFQCKGERVPLRRPLSPPGGNLYPQLRLQDDLARQPPVIGPLSRAPALLIRGDCDYLPLATAARYMKAFPAATRIDVPGRGHAFYGHDDDLRMILHRYASTTLRSLP